MYYSLNENVYLVEGCKKSCIYDFNNNELYQINKNLTDLINRVNCKAVEKCCLTSEEDIFIKKLIEKQIVIETAEVKKKKNIKQIKIANKIKFAWIEITTKCNLKCMHCYNESSCLSEKEMSIEDYLEVIDSLLKLGVNRIQLIGGEPFYNAKALKRMLDISVGRFEFIEIFTNGTFITEDWADYLKKNNIRVAISVYSYDEKMHDEVTRVGGSYRRTNDSIRMLDRIGVKYRVCNIIMKNIDLGNKNTDLYTLSETKDIVRMSGRASLNLLSDELIKKKLITKDTFAIPLNKSLCQRIVSGHNCFSNKIYISTEKEVYPCVMERRFSHGKIESGEIKLNGDIINFDKDMIDECKNCEFRYACFDCRPNSLSNDIYEKPWYCTYNPKNGEWEEVEIFVKKLKALYN